MPKVLPMETSKQALGIAGIALHLGVPIGTVYSWKSRGQLPEPDITSGKSLFWYVKTIDRWKSPTERHAPKRMKS